MNMEEVIPWLKASKIRTIIKKYMKHTANELGFIIHKDTTLYKVVNDIVQVISFEVSLGHFYCNVFVRPLYYEKLHDWILSIYESIEKIKDRELIEAYDLETEEQVKEKLKYVEMMIREDALEWFDKYDTAEKIIDNTDDKKLKAFSYLYLKDRTVGKKYFLEYYDYYIQVFNNAAPQYLTEYSYKEKELIERIMLALQTDLTQVDTIIQEIIQKVRQNMKIK